jgi:hypothetical protein
MRYFRTQAFERGFRALPRNRQERVMQAMERLNRLFVHGERPEGLGLKQLRHGIWEVRAGLADRLLFQREEDEIQFLLVGDHNDIKRRLKQL